MAPEKPITYKDFMNQIYKLRKKLATMQDISKSFLTRVILKVDSGKNPPGWTREHTFSIGMDDPRST
ncbi:MAG: hypothetical protein KKB85_03890, partial [Candidatus Altiarchaeota archaeon]|nr:hypothetical protein [Candidatus Altiarchaeota archaeon]